MLPSSGSDAHWERYGRLDPYFGVLSADEFKSENLDQAATERFFATGQEHIDHVLATVRAHLAPDFEPAKALDFGCGVGRLVIPLAALVDEVVGVDVANSMLEEARRNCEARHIGNVSLVTQLEDLPATASFDFIHSYVVFQHIRVARGERMVRQLLACLTPGGVVALHFTYDAPRYARLVHWLMRNIPLTANLYNLFIGRRLTYPIMQSNFYDLNRLFQLLQSAGCGNAHLEFERHNRNDTVMIYSQKATAT